MIITEPGIYLDVPPGIYHADPVQPLSLSRGIAHKMIVETPRHAYRAHPKLGGQSDIIPNRAMDDGSAIHSLMLSRGGDIEVITATYGEKHKRAGEFVDDFKTDAAREMQEEIRRRGNIPMLMSRRPLIQRCAETALEQLRAHQDGAAFFEAGASEAVVVWEEDGIWFRIMVDRLPDDPNAPFYDVKATGMLANPGGWERRLQNLYAFQAAFYERGLRKVRGQTGQMLFVVVETEEPHCLSVMGAAPSLREIAEEQVERAIQMWRECLRTNKWPGYPPFTAYVEATPYQMVQHVDQISRDEFVMEHMT